VAQPPGIPYKKYQPPTDYGGEDDADGGYDFSSMLMMAVLGYGWMPHNASFGFLDLTPSILHSNWF
jgi:hypothetical protein